MSHLETKLGLVDEIDVGGMPVFGVAAYRANLVSANSLNTVTTDELIHTPPVFYLTQTALKAQCMSANPEY